MTQKIFFFAKCYNLHKSTYIHLRVSVDQTLFCLEHLVVWIFKRKSKPVQVAIILSFTIVLTFDDGLDGLYLKSTLRSIYPNSAFLLVLNLAHHHHLSFKLIHLRRFGERRLAARCHTTRSQRRTWDDIFDCNVIEKVLSRQVTSVLGWND